MRLRSRKMLIGLFLLLMALGLPWGVYQYQSWQAGNQLADVVAALDRTETPWRLADLEKRRKVIPDERNSAVLIRKANPGNLWKIFRQPEELDLPPWQVLPPAVLIKLRAGFDQCEEQLIEARRIADFPDGRFTYTIAPDVISTLIPHLDNVRPVAILLVFDAKWQIQQGNFEQAAQSCRAAVMTARSLRDEPFLIVHLARLAMLREVTMTLERMVAQGQPPVELLGPLQKLLLEEADFDGWTVAIEGERAGLHQLFEHMRSHHVDPQYLRGLMGSGRNDWRTWLGDRFAAATVQQSHVWLLRHFNDLLATRDLPHAERSAKRKALQDQINQAPELARVLMASVWRATHPVFSLREAKLRCAAAGLAAEQFRQQHKRWPKTLDELAPDLLAKVPLDPFTGEPLQLRATRDGIVIFSVGPDGTLRGDAPRDEPNAPNLSERIDCEFRLWNVDQRRRVK